MRKLMLACVVTVFALSAQGCNPWEKDENKMQIDVSPEKSDLIKVEIHEKDKAGKTHTRTVWKEGDPK